MSKKTTGWVACDYTRGDRLDSVRHARIRAKTETAENDRRSGGYQGVRWVSEDGYLYVDRPEEEEGE